MRKNLFDLLSALVVGVNVINIFGEGIRFDGEDRCVCRSGV